MSLLDHLTRIDHIVNKYDKYGKDKPEKDKERPIDAFETMYQRMEDTVDQLMAKAEEVQNEKARSVAAMVNADIRRSKNALKAEVPALAKVHKKKAKGLAAEVVEERAGRLEELQARIEAIPDGVSTLVAKQTKALDASHVTIAIQDTTEADLQAGGVGPSMEHTEESRAFRQEFELAKQKQDQHLDDISRGLTTLRQLGDDMNNELGKQAVLVEDMDTKVDTASAELKTANAKLKATLTSVRSSRNFCIDIVLVSLLLGIGAYIYNLVK